MTAVAPSLSAGGRPEKMIGPAVLLALITIIVYLPLLSHQFIESWDDRTAILDNPDYNPPRIANLVHYWTQRPARNLLYVPVTYTVWGLLAMIARHPVPGGWPFHAAYFYGANLLAHTAASVSVLGILTRLGIRAWPAFFGAALFALHPMQVESLAFAWSLYTPLSTLFGFLAILQYLAFSKTQSQPARNLRRHYVYATVFFVLAVLTKPTAIALPLILVALEVIVRGRTWRQTLPALSWLLVVLPVIVINKSAFKFGVYIPDPMLRPMVPLDAIAFYLGKLFWPYPLVLDYGRTPYLIAGRPAIQPTCFITLALLLTAFLTRKRWPWVFAAVCVFVAGLLPTIGITPTTFQYFSTVADRYIYMAMLGPAIALAFVLHRAWFRWAAGGASLLLVALGLMTIHQLRYWQDDWAVAAHTLTIRPNSSAGNGTLGYLTSKRDHDDHTLPGAWECSLDATQLSALGDVLAQANLHAMAVGVYKVALDKSTETASLYGRLAEESLLDEHPDAAERFARASLHMDPKEPHALSVFNRLATTQPTR